MITENLRVRLVEVRKRSGVHQLSAVARDDGKVDVVIDLGAPTKFVILPCVWPGTADGWLQSVYDSYLRRCLDDARACLS